MARTIVARLIVALIIGIGIGYAVGQSMANDVARGKALTMKSYIDDFENHRKDLLSSDNPMSFSVIVGALLVLFFFGVYELLVFCVDRALRLLDRRREDEGFRVT